ncbi:hypothetical protein [Lentisphaera araneosa]|nr:hypothetical protein [Lentisphaera araneosa]
MKSDLLSVSPNYNFLWDDCDLETKIFKKESISNGIVYSGSLAY